MTVRFSTFVSTVRPKRTPTRKVASVSQDESTPKYTLRENSLLCIAVGHSNGYVGLTPYVDSQPVPLIRDEQTGDLYFVTPEDPAIKFGINTNGVKEVVAIPVRVGNGTQWCNLYLDCPDTNPTTMPRSGMREIRQDGSQEFEGYKTASKILPFFGADDYTDLGLPNGFGAVNIIEFYVREPDPEGTQVNNDGTVINRPGMLAKASSLGADSPTPDRTISTEVTYQSTAYLLARVRFITPQQALDMLREEYPEANIDPTNQADWTTGAIKARFPNLTYLIVNPQRYANGTGGANTEAIYR